MYIKEYLYLHLWDIVAVLLSVLCESRHLAPLQLLQGLHVGVPKHSHGDDDSDSSGHSDIDSGSDGDGNIGNLQWLLGRQRE